MQNGKSLGKNFSAVLLSANIKASAETLGKVMLQTVANVHYLLLLSIMLLCYYLHVHTHPTTSRPRPCAKRKNFQIHFLQDEQENSRGKLVLVFKIKLKTSPPPPPPPSKQIQNSSKYVVLAKQQKSNLTVHPFISRVKVSQDKPA